MPKCKNDNNKYYRGIEPSPKGIGYCAHACKLGQIKKGKNGKKWIVKATKNKIKRWVQIKNKLIKIQILLIQINLLINFIKLTKILRFILMEQAWI